jgi:hypothetical protein
MSGGMLVTVGVILLALAGAFLAGVALGEAMEGRRARKTLREGMRW